MWRRRNGINCAELLSGAMNDLVRFNPLEWEKLFVTKIGILQTMILFTINAEMIETDPDIRL